MGVLKSRQEDGNLHIIWQDPSIHPWFCYFTWRYLPTYLCHHVSQIAPPTYLQSIHVACGEGRRLPRLSIWILGSCLSVEERMKPYIQSECYNILTRGRARAHIHIWHTYIDAYQLLPRRKGKKRSPLEQGISHLKIPIQGSDPMSPISPRSKVVAYFGGYYATAT